MKPTSHFPPVLGRSLYYVVLAALGLLVLLAVAGLAQLAASTPSAGRRGSAPGLLLGSTGPLATAAAAAKLPLARQLVRSRWVVAG